jgi:hypothetical protein
MIDGIVEEIEENTSARVKKRAEPNQSSHTG